MALLDGEEDDYDPSLSVLCLKTYFLDCNLVRLRPEWVGLEIDVD